jgi:hypothetical protein
MHACIELGPGQLKLRPLLRGGGKREGDKPQAEDLTNTATAQQAKKSG